MDHAALNHLLFIDRPNGRLSIGIAEYIYAVFNAYGGNRPAFVEKGFVTRFGFSMTQHDE